MALLFEKEIGFARIAIWEATESREQLMRMAGDVVTDPGFATITSEKRQFEWLAVRVLLRLMVGSEIKLDYLPDGAPVLAGNPSGFRFHIPENISPLFFIQIIGVG